MSKLASNWATSITGGEYRRKDSVFRRCVGGETAGDDGLEAESGRYHLYVSLACPWAHRTLIFRKLKQLEDHISVSVVHPDMHNKGWTFAHDENSETLYATTGDTLYAGEFLSERYIETDERYAGNITVPVLWDKKTQQIVNNESSEIIRMLNFAFNDLTGNTDDYYPEQLRAAIDEVNEWVYHDINNGVYKTGFARTQAAYEKNFNKLFAALDKAEQILSKQRYIAGNVITEADWRLFTTLIRFDSVYHTHFKCNLRLLKEYENIYHYMLELYQFGDIASTVHMPHIKRHYYASHLAINPFGIVPLGHQQDWSVAHNRDSLTGEAQ